MQNDGRLTSEVIMGATSKPNDTSASGASPRTGGAKSVDTEDDRHVDGVRPTEENDEVGRGTYRPPKISEAVARGIVRDIATRQLKPGAMLPPENAMLAKYRVGRASLREALRILEIHGLITLKPGPRGGPVVAGPTSRDLGRTLSLYFHIGGADFRQLTEARLLLEPWMAGLAAQHQDQDLLRKLQSVIDREGTLPVDDDESWIQITSEFHSVVAGMSGNRILTPVARALKAIHTDRARGVLHPPSERAGITAAHKAIAQAIIKGQASRAERLMRAHLEEHIEFLTERYSGLLDEVIDWQ